MDGDRMVNQTTLEPIHKLFSDARNTHSVDYVYTLVRVTGYNLVSLDELLELQERLKTISIDHEPDQLLHTYCSLTATDEPLALVANLLNCISRRPFNPFPFHQLSSGKFPAIKRPSPVEVVREVAKMARETDRLEVAQMIEEAYHSEILTACSQREPAVNEESLRSALRNCRDFLSRLLQTYFAERLSYQPEPRFYKLPRFEVLELLVDGEYGLHGFRVYFSNGSHAEFVRRPRSTEPLNITFEDRQIGFMVGDVDQLKPEWCVGDKRLYEIGLQGRYNKLGEWKPMVYPGSPDHLLQEVRSLAEDDDVQGALFYIFCTGHRIVEFVARTNIELPKEGVTFGEDVHFWKCQPLREIPETNQNVFVYDGWVEIGSVDADSIRLAIARVGVALNRMAFAYGGSLQWRIKYRTVEGGGCATPSEGDLALLNSFLIDFPKREDAILLDFAIDWYNRGLASRDPFTAFLCYYIALESVAVAVADGTADLGLGYPIKSKSQQKLEIEKCIRALHAGIYAKDPARFVREAYSECVGGLRAKTRLVAELAFGRKHPYVSLLFKKRNGYSLYDIRNKIAHGAFTLLNRDQVKLVRIRLGEMGEISNEFLTRVIFLLKPEDAVPSWSRLHRAALAMADPRATLFVTREDILPTSDWRIRPEWCD